MRWACLTAARWWHHDDRNGAPARTAYDSSATSNNYRQQPAQQQYAMQSQSPMRPEASEFEPTPQPTPAAAQAAPGFNRAGPAVAKAQLPKCWEYEDPLKDVHGPFDAAQIINWFAQDWFGTDLKIRRIGQYWTMLEYVLEELKAEARGTSAPSSTYTTAPQQVPQAATTPAASYGTQRSTTVTVPTASYGRSAAAAAPVAAGGIEQWGPNSNTASYPAAAAAVEDTWGPPVGPSSRSDRVMDRGFGSAAAAAGPAAVQARPRGRGAEDYGNSGGFGSEDYSGVRGRGARDKEREAVAAAAAGVQYGTDGKWERGYVIEGENRRGARNSRNYQDYDSYGDEYGSSSSRRGRGRASRSDRGADRYGDGRETGSGYDRATKILEGTEDDEYGGSARSRGRATRESRGVGQGTGGSGGLGYSSTDVWPGGNRDSKQEPDVWPSSSTARDPAATAAKANRSKRDSKAATASKDSMYPKPDDSKDAAAAVAAATAALGSIGLSGAGSGSLANAVPAVDTHTGGWGNVPAKPDAATTAEEDGWGSTKAKPLRGKWGDEPVDSDSPTADELAAGPPATASTAGAEDNNSDVQPQPAAAATGAESQIGDMQPQPIAAAAIGEADSKPGQPEASAVATLEVDSTDVDVQPQTAALTAGGTQKRADPADAAAAAGGLAQHAAAEGEGHPAGTPESKYSPPAVVAGFPVAQAAAEQVEPVSANSTVAAAQFEADSKPEDQEPAPASAAPAEASPTANSEEKPKLSKVQQLIKMQEQQLQQQEAGNSKHSPGRSATPSAGRSATPPPGRSSTPPRNQLRNSASAGSLTGQAGANGTASPTAAVAAAAAFNTAAGSSEDGKDVSSIGAAVEHATAAAPAADHDPDLAGPRSAAGAAEGGSTAIGGKSVAGITAGIFSRVAGALMGSGSSSSTSEGKAVERADADVE